MWQRISKEISATTGETFHARTGRPVGGGCINAAYLVEDGARRFLVKINQASNLAMFEAEAEGLNEISATRTIRAPAPICTGLALDSAFLVLEFIDLYSREKGGEELLGRQLADMHRVTSTQHGWHRDNTIGATLQINTVTDNWLEFWRDRRLAPQLALAARNGHNGRLQHQAEHLMARLDEFLAGHNPPPSLLHGDLWSGNRACSHSGEPVIFDPAVYYGDRETDLAMTELFGGFSATFYAAYREAFPLDPGYSVRKTLYNLYHVLNHLNLFGGGYSAQAESMIEKLLSETA
ncbi:MAG: fructosamine kinase family protein [Betaproteobacteria bacterium]|nr:fructosamine kinase family protein [Betaproteobacteria bacterium]